MLHHPSWRSDEVEHDANEAVDRDLGHDPAHQRRNVAGGGRMRERQPDVQRHQAGLGAGADERKDQNGGRERRRGMAVADVAEGISAVRSRQQSEGEQQRERPEARHDQVDVSRTNVVGDAVVRHHQRPRRQRHEFPRQQERERIVGEHDDAHAGEKRRIERQHPARSMLVAAISEREQARSGRAEVDYGEKKRRKRIQTKMRSKPRNAEWKDGRRRTGVDAEESEECDREKRQRGDQAHSVDEVVRTRNVGQYDGEGRRRDQHGGAGKRHEHHQLPPARRAAAPANGPSQRKLVPLPFQPHAASAAVADRSLADQFDARRRQRFDEFHQRIHIAPDDPVARFHALDGGQRKTRTLGQLALIDLQQRSCGSHLCAGYHALNIRIDGQCTCIKA
jgi:hypothetical protein